MTLSHGFGAGGNSDTVARILAPVLAERLGQQVIVEPRVGAGGNLATERTVKAAPDGYTLIVLTGGHAVSGALYKALPFHPVDDLQMLSTLIYFPFIISVRKDHRFQSLADLVAEAKAKPKTITYSSVGVGSTQHLAGELLASLAGIELVHVPYRGGQAPVTDLLGGRIDVMVDTLTVTRPQLDAGTIRGLAVTSPKAWPGLTGIPPAGDTVKGYDVRSWMGIATTKGVPEPIVKTLNADILLRAAAAAGARQAGSDRQRGARIVAGGDARLDRGRDREMAQGDRRRQGRAAIALGQRLAATRRQDLVTLLSGHRARAGRARCGCGRVRLAR